MNDLKKIIQRVLACILTMSLVILMMPASTFISFAEEEEPGEVVLADEEETVVDEVVVPTSDDDEVIPEEVTPEEVVSEESGSEDLPEGNLNEELSEEELIALCSDDIMVTSEDDGPSEPATPDLSTVPDVRFAAGWEWDNATNTHVPSSAVTIKAYLVTITSQTEFLTLTPDDILAMENATNIGTSVDGILTITKDMLTGFGTTYNHLFIVYSLANTSQYFFSSSSDDCYTLERSYMIRGYDSLENYKNSASYNNRTVEYIVNRDKGYTVYRDDQNNIYAQVQIYYGYNITEKVLEISFPNSTIDVDLIEEISNYVNQRDTVQRGTLSTRINSFTNYTLTAAQIAKIKSCNIDSISIATTLNDTITTVIPEQLDVSISDTSKELKITKFDVTVENNNLFGSGVPSIKVELTGTFPGTVSSAHVLYPLSAFNCIQPDTFYYDNSTGKLISKGVCGYGTYNGAYNTYYRAYLPSFNDTGGTYYFVDSSVENYFNPIWNEYTELSTPLSLSWDQTNPWQLVVNDCSNSTNDYQIINYIELFEDDTYVTSYDFSNKESWSNYDPNFTTTPHIIDLSAWITKKESTYKVIAYKNCRTYWTEQTDSKHIGTSKKTTRSKTYNTSATTSVPEAQIYAIKDQVGKYKIVPASNNESTCFMVTLYTLSKNSTSWSKWSTRSLYLDSIDDTDELITDYSYVIKNSSSYWDRFKVTVRAVSNNPDTKLHSKEVEVSEILDINKVAESATNNVNDAINDLNSAIPTEGTATEKATAAKNAVQDFKDALKNTTDNANQVSLSELAVSMQKNEAALETIVSYEEAYIAACNGSEATKIEVADPVVETAVANLGISSESIDMTGAALNLNPGETIKLDVSVPSVEKPIDTTKYTGGVQLDFKLQVTDRSTGNATEKEELDVPIVIEIPIPTGVSLYNIVILHYHNNGEPEFIYPEINSITGKMKFSITKLSTFVIANEIVQSASASSSSTTVAEESAPARTLTGSAAAVAAAKAATASCTASGSILLINAVSDATLTSMNTAAAKLSKNAVVLSVAEYTGTLKAGGEVIRINCAAIKKGDTLRLIHDGKKGRETLKPVEVGDGYVTVFMTDLSPIAIVKLPAGTSSPKTGEDITLLEYLIEKAFEL